MMFMGMNTIIKLERRTQKGWLLWLLIIMPFLLGTLTELLRLPWALRYAMDFAWITLVIYLLWNRKVYRKQIVPLVLWIVLFLIYTFLSYVVQYQSGFYFLWGFRNLFRFYGAFLVFAVLLKPKDVANFLKLFDILFWINIAVSMIQFFVLGLKGDYLGGIFSTELGGNGYTNIFFVIMATKSILLYIEKKEKLSWCILKCATMLMVAALAEMKFFFLEFIGIVVLAILFSKFTWRKLAIIIASIIAVVLFATLLEKLFPIFEGFLSLEYLIDSALSDKGYTSSGDLNRLNAIPKINELWLKSGWQRLFGLGLGNCDTASFAFLNTPFYEANGYMHYSWRSYALMYLECGWIGLIFYFGFFVLVYLSIRRIEKRCSGVATTYCRMGRILALMCMIIAIYNSSLRTEAGYMMYFALSVPFVMRRDQIGAARRGEKK